MIWMDWDKDMEAGFDEAAKEKAQALVQGFEEFLEENKDELDALQFFYSQPYTARLRYTDIKALAEAIEAPPRRWTPEAIWRAYQTLMKDKVRGASGERLLTNIVSLVRFALHQSEELVPYPELVQQRFVHWLDQQVQAGREFTEEQVRWLEMIRDHVARSLEIDVQDFDHVPFVQEGGLGKAAQVFGGELGGLLKELNEVLVA